MLVRIEADATAFCSAPFAKECDALTIAQFVSR
jgi:hypothetical protein